MKYFKVLYFLFNVTFINQLSINNDFINFTVAPLISFGTMVASICLKYQLDRYFEKQKLLEKMKFINFDEISGDCLSDMVGYEDQKYLLRKYFDDFFKPFNESNIKISNGILLYGGSGNGKTSMLFSLAKETKTPLICLSINDLLVSSISLTDSINNMFAYLESCSQCILVLDEIDLILKNREKCNLTENQEKILAMFLQKLDGAGGRGLKKKRNVLIIGTTNHKNTLDQALLRPGRLGKHIEFNNHSVSDIVLLFKKYGKYSKFKNNLVEQYLEKNKIYDKINNNNYSLADTIDYIQDLNDLIKEKEKSTEDKDDNEVEAEQKVEATLNKFNRSFKLL